MRRLEHELPPLDLRPRAILDAGAEDASFVYWLADHFPDATVAAVDIDEAAIAACVATRPGSYRDRVQFRLARFADLEPASFDLITALDVLDLIEDGHEAVLSLTRALRPGGTLLAHVPRDRWLTRDGVSTPCPTRRRGASTPVTCSRATHPRT